MFRFPGNLSLLDLIFPQGNVGIVDAGGEVLPPGPQPVSRQGVPGAPLLKSRPSTGAERRPGAMTRLVALTKRLLERGATLGGKSFAGEMKLFSSCWRGIDRALWGDPREMFLVLM